ncbi:hypothetical protein VTN77DRAFT_3478 [Rasamsonia byssochlamydoides]|uniref:uncharacterized protein n=1 Tax=Rasamsonia byssochlamydoides TaxID=89139 RepID=UPI00374305AC
MDPTGLPSLSTELVLLILQSLSSPRDLYSLIRASVSCYRTFVSYRYAVFSAILQNAIHPAARADALMALNARQIAGTFKEKEYSLDVVRLRAFDYLKSYPSPEPARSLREMVMSAHEQLEKLFRFYSVVEGFVSDYCDRALRQLNTSRLTPTATTPTSTTLSSTELGRLQRAFFRFETYADLFQLLPQHKVAWVPESVLDETEPALAFLSRFSSWEIEEIACVSQFVAALVGEIFDKVEDDFVHAVEEAVASRRCQDTRDDENFAWLTFLEWYCPPFFKDYTRDEKDNHIDFVVSRGLLFVKRLLRLEPLSLRKEVFDSAFDGSYHIRHLQLALADSNPVRRKIKAERRAAKSSNKVRVPSNADDSLTRCNIGWLWAFGYKRAAITINAAGNSDLRDQGYVFWDRDRLQQSGLLRSPRVRNEGNDLDYPYQNRTELSSVEERLRHLKVPGKVIEELVPDYCPTTPGTRTWLNALIDMF